LSRGYVSDIGIEGFDALELIGQGGFGHVYRAQQPAFQRTVAIKVLSSPADDEDVQRRFQRECHAIGSLSGHPNIVTVFDSGISQWGRPYIVMEYMSRGSSNQLSDKGLAWPIVARLGARIADAIVTAHAAGILHRDIKPENILISEYDEPKLGDFGISRLSDGTQTRSGVITASITHAAPEILDGASATEATDVYALASSMYELLAGQPAFVRRPDESLPALALRIMTAPPDLAQLDAPEDFKSVIGAALEKSPADRMPTASMFRDRLLALDGELAPTGRLPHGPGAPRPANNDRVTRAREPQHLTPLVTIPTQPARPATGPKTPEHVASPDVTRHRHRDALRPTAPEETTPSKRRFGISVITASLLGIAVVGLTSFLVLQMRQDGDQNSELGSQPLAAAQLSPSPAESPVATRTRVFVHTKPNRLRLRADKFRVTLQASAPACLANRQGLLQRVTAGRDPVVGRARSTRQGSWLHAAKQIYGTLYVAFPRQAHRTDSRVLTCSATKTQRLARVKPTPSVPTQPSSTADVQESTVSAPAGSSSDPAPPSGGGSSKPPPQPIASPGGGNPDPIASPGG